MSDVVVQVAETTTTVSVTETSVNVNVVESPVQVSVGTSGPQGAVGAGVATGGTAGQFLVKNSATNYDTSWTDHINSVIQQYVKNDGVALLKGQAVYVSGANGTNIIVSAADNGSEATSSKTIGLLLQDLSINAFGYVVTQGILSGFNTSSATAGDAVWLGTNGNLIFGLANKPAAPAHLVYLGVVTRAHATQGEVFVNVQNGFELQELHNVQISSPSNNQILQYDSATSLWKNTAGTVAFASQSGTAVYSTSAGSATTAGAASSADYATTAGTASFATAASTATNAGTASFASQAGTATYSTTSGTAVYGTTAGSSVYATNAGTAVYATSAGSATSAGAATTAGTATYATTAGTSVYATNAGTVVYATTSGTAVSISGSITPSQVTGTAVITTDSRLSDSRTPTAHAASHASGGSDAVTLAQSQVTNLTSDLAARALLTGGNTFSGAQIISGTGGATSRLEVASTSASSFALFRFKSSDNSAFDFGKNDISNQSGSAYFWTTASIPIEFSNASTRRLTIESNGNINIGGSSGTSLAKLTVFNTSASAIGAVIRGAASQSANLQEWQVSDGSIAAAISNFGAMRLGSASNFGGVLSISTGNSTNNGTVIRGAASQLSDVFVYQSSAGTVIGGRNANAQIYTGSTAPLTTAVGGATTATSGTGTTATITTTSAHNLAVGDRITVAGITPTGYNGTFIVTAVTSTTVSYANATTGAQTVAGTVSVDAQASVTARSAGTTGLIVRAAASQAGDLLSVQNNSGTALARIDNGGSVVATTIQTTGGSASLRVGNAGGILRLGKATASAGASTNDFGQLMLLNGTNANTMKLVIVSGASNTVTTILDNIPNT